MIIFKLLYESIVMALNSLRMNKVRTILSLLGITIGIFSVISVFTVFDSMQNNITSSINSLGNNVLYIQKWPWLMGGNYPWWKYYQRPQPKPQEVKEILKRSYAAQDAAFMFGVSRNVYYRDNSVEDAPIMAISYEYNKVMSFELNEGRYFTRAESLGGRNMAIIGATIAEELFPHQNPIGKEIKVFGRRLHIIGVMKKQGNNMFGTSSDNQVIVPLNFARDVVDTRHISGTIVVKGKPNVSIAELKSELTGIMRSIRKLRPNADDNFSINQTDIITKGFDSLFHVISLVGWIIGAFSLLVGGFGIANIMFVTVKERTGQIGIQKSLGAKNYFILLQFLFEAIFLAVLGGIVGLLIVYILTFIASHLMGFPLTLYLNNIMLGIIVSIIIGLVSGYIPAWTAARLEPVEAMRTTF